MVDCDDFKYTFYDGNIVVDSLLRSCMGFVCNMYIPGDGLLMHCSVYMANSSIKE